LKLLNILLVLSIFGSAMTPVFAQTTNDAVPLAATEPSYRYRQAADGIDLEIKQYPLVGRSSKHSKKNRAKKVGRAFYPVELEITNKNRELLCIAPTMIDAKLVDLNKVASKMTKTNTLYDIIVGGGLGVTGGVVAGGTGFVLLTTLNPVAAIVTLPIWGLFGICAGIGMAVVGIPSVLARNNKLYNQNKDILEERMLFDTCYIKPGQTVSKFVFINEQDYQNSFKMRLENGNDQKITFDVKLAPSPVVA